MDDATRGLLEKCCAQGWPAMLALYGDYLEDSPEDTWIPASALRILARQEAIPDAGLPPLMIALDAAPDLAAFTHLCKAVAAFGREAEEAGPLLLRRLKDMHLTDDENFWAFDSGLHALGYTGGEGATEFLATLRQESPRRSNRSDSVYRGDIGPDERREWFARSLDAVDERLAMKDPGKWLKKMTKHTFEGAPVENAKLSPWMTR